MTVATARQQPVKLTIPLPRHSTPGLKDGDRMGAEEFLRRWEAMPELKFAELIRGRVCIMSPLYRKHGRSDVRASMILAIYASLTPGCDCCSNTTNVLGEEVLQPDVFLCLTQDHGEESETDEDGCLTTAAELVIEVANTTASRDLNEKKEIYECAGVREYIVLVTGPRAKAVCMRLQNGRFVEDNGDGVFKSAVFPGLWVDTGALLRNDGAAALKTLNEGMSTPEYRAFASKSATEDAGAPLT